MNILGTCKKCCVLTWKCILTPPSGVYPPDCPEEVSWGHMPPKSLLPSFSRLPIEHMTVNTCFPVCVCDLRNGTGNPGKVTLRFLSSDSSLNYSSWCCPVVPLHHSFQGCQRKEAASHYNRKHPPTSCFGIKSKGKPTTVSHSKLNLAVTSP